MAEPLAWLNGRFLPREEALLPIHDGGLVFGASVTDFCRTFRKKLFRWTDHLIRFRSDCQFCFIPLHLDDNELTAIAHELVARNTKLIGPDQELALITFATPGPFAFYAGTPAQDAQPTLCLHTITLPFERYRSFFSEGVALALGGEHSCEPNDLVSPRVKHRNRLHWWRADHLVRRRQHLEIGPKHQIPLLHNGYGHLTETAIGNLLVVRNGAIHTPAHVALAGVSLRVIDDICAQLGIPFSAQEGITLDACSTASEIMLCGSAFCVAGVSWLEGRSIPWPGPILQRLLAAWSERVGVDIAAQFLSAP